jgi:hypothetical protein
MAATYEAIVQRFACAECGGDKARPAVTEGYCHFRLFPHPDIPCAWCGRYVMGEEACPNAKDICSTCCGED